MNDGDSSEHLSGQIIRILFGFFQADANVRVHLTDRGEHVLVTAGEVHLERCLRDLRETYAGVEVVASEPGITIRY
jgi:ribosome assembly protein 1